MTITVCENLRTVSAKKYWPLPPLKTIESLDCKYIYENNGGLRGFYKGFFSTLIFLMTTSMFYFGGYEYIKKHLYERYYRIFSNQIKEKHLRLNILLSGTLGGLCAWSICYPLNIIRSEIQTDDLRPEKRKYTSYLDCVKQLYE